MNIFGFIQDHNKLFSTWYGCILKLKFLQLLTVYISNVNNIIVMFGYNLVAFF